MSRGDWGKKLGPWLVGLGLFVVAAIIAGTVWYVAKTSLENRDDSDQSTGQIRAEAERYVSERCVGLNFRVRDHCVADAEKAAHNQKQTEADLYAQRQMAVWALAVGVSGLISIPLTLAGIFFVWRTLAHNSLANRLTMQAINQERINAKRQLRAYVHLTTSIAQWNVDRTKLEWHFIFQNFGQTPAKKVRVFVSGGMWPTEDYEVRFNLPPLDTGGPSESIAPSQQRELHGNVEESLTDEQASLVNGKTAIILVWGRIEYFDIFSMKRTTYFRRMLTVIPEKSVIGFSPPMSGQVNFSICPSPDEDT